MQTSFADHSSLPLRSEGCFDDVGGDPETRKIPQHAGTFSCAERSQEVVVVVLEPRTCSNNCIEIEMQCRDREAIEVFLRVSRGAREGLESARGVLGVRGRLP